MRGGDQSGARPMEPDCAGKPCLQSRAMQVIPSIFKAYDIRGIHGDELGPDAAEQIGRAFVRVLSRMSGRPRHELRLGLGRDMRLTDVHGRVVREIVA